MNPLTLVLLAAVGEWQVLSEGPIYIRQRQLQDGVKELEASGVMDARLDAVQATILDCQGSPRFMPHMRECRQVGDQLFYVMIEPKFLFFSLAKVDTVTRNVNYIGDGSFRQSWVAVVDIVPLREGVTRLQVNSGSWSFTKDGDRVRAVYHVQSDAPYAPDWAVRSSTYDLFQAVAKEASKK